MRVLSLFDGMSCGQIALKELGIKVDEYIASEIEPVAISQTMNNFPNTKQIGDVRNVDGRTLGKIDLLIGGSPCTNFSFGGFRYGMTTKEKHEIHTLEEYLKLKDDGFQFEGQSYLFWEYVRILTELREVNPDVKFMLENVQMSKRWEAVLSKAIGCEGVHIDSALVSAQHRKRIYWTNISDDIVQPKDRKIMLADIMEPSVDPKYYNHPLLVKQWTKYGGTISKRDYPYVKQYPRGFNDGFEHHDRKVPALTASVWQNNNFIIYPDGRIRSFTPTECARLQTIPSWYKWTCANSHICRILGNGWTVEVIKHLLAYLVK